MSVFRGAVLGAVLLALAVLVVLQTPALRAGAASRVDRVRGYEVGSGIDPSFALSGGDELIQIGRAHV